MLNFRLIFCVIWIFPLVQGNELKILDNKAVNKRIHSTEFTLIGYLGNTECMYTDYFLEQMKILTENLKDVDVEIALTREPLKLNEVLVHNYPLLVAHRGLEKSKIPITWAHKAKDIENWVRIKLFEAKPTLVVNNIDEYNRMLNQFGTIFSGHLTDKDELEIYRKIADEFNAVFLEINDLEVVKSINKDEGQWIMVEHLNISKERRRASFSMFHGPNYFRQWIKNQIRQPTYEIFDRKAAIAFGSNDVHNFAILFTSKNASDYEYKINYFIEKINDGSKKVVNYYVNLDNSESQELVRYFNVPTDHSTLVFVKNMDEIQEQFFTKRCSTKSRDLAELSQTFKAFDEIHKYYQAIYYL